MLSNAEYETMWEQVASRLLYQFQREGRLPLIWQMTWSRGLTPRDYIMSFVRESAEEFVATGVMPSWVGQPVKGGDHA
jgi:hypothetical protein